MYSHSGASLIEILVSFTILSIILLGSNLSLIQSFKEVENAYYFNAANQQLINMAEYLQIDPSGVSKDLLQEWNKQNATILPQGYGVIADDSISIFWGEKTALKCEKNKIGQSGCLRLGINTN